MRNTLINKLVGASLVLAVATATSAPRTAFAQGASNEAAAQALFDQARGLMQAGNFAEACAKFAESDRLAPGAGTLLNLGGCYEKNGQTASAWATYADAASAADKANRKDWAARAKTRMAAISPDLSKLSIVVPASSQTDGLEVKRDGVVVGASSYGVPIPVDPGPHVIDATAPGHKKWSNVVQVASKKDQIAVSIPPLEAAPDAKLATPPAAAVVPPAEQAIPDQTDHSHSNTQRVIGIGVAGVGVVGVAVGAVFGLIASGKKGDAGNNCNADLSKCNASGVSDMSSARSSATISTVGFIAGGALLAGGVVLYLTAPKANQEKAVGLRIAPNGAGANLTFGGAW
ncbi:MAG: hypothetical protein ABI461_07255 [Polyangiaceae bacterium]